MRRALSTLCVPILIYAIGGFMAWDWAVWNWTPQERIVLVFISIVTACFWNFLIDLFEVF